MIIETYIDASKLSRSQTLVITDDTGKSWDVLEALNSSDTLSESTAQGQQHRNTEVVLERWKVELKFLDNDFPDDFGPVLPTIYKRSIVFFRSLYVTAHVLPTWKYSQQGMAASIHPALSVKSRVLTAPSRNSVSVDSLRHPLYEGTDAVVSDYMFGDLEVPVGRFNASVSYRNECNFRVDDAESLLSSRFMGMGIDEDFFKPSIPQRRDQSKTEGYTEVGSLPSHRNGRGVPEQQTYGSLSTFHGTGAIAASPISALKAIRPLGSDTSSPSGSVPAGNGLDPPHSLPISGQSGSRPPIRPLDGMARRPSISFNPFKAGSLAGSPRLHEGDVPPSPQSLSRGSYIGGVNQARNRNSLTAGMAASLRGNPPPVESSPVGSPKPSRYSSSFPHRRNRPSFGGNSKAVDDEQGSSGKQSLASSAQPGSGLLAETGGNGSSGSLQTDDDNLSEFLKVIDSKRTLPSFEPGHKRGESSSRRTTVQLSKFQLMRDSNNALTESITSSALQRSSSESSRQLQNVPSMVNPASMSTSSSPGKPLSPHTPHTPAIPSRLSENSIVEYSRHGPIAQPPEITTTEENDEPVSQASEATAIDIPLSPRLQLRTDNRRASSVAQQHRDLADEDETDVPFGGHRSLSLGADERDPPSRSSLLGRTTAAESDESPSLQAPADIRATAGRFTPREREDRNIAEALPPGGRLRYSSRGRPTPPHSSRGSFSGGRYGSLTRGTGGDEAEDEPLVFDLSELVRDPGRRSIEEGRGGGNSGSGSVDRAGYDSARGSRRW
jgi:autophagy-related protein 13